MIPVNIIKNDLVKILRIITVNYILLKLQMVFLKFDVYPLLLFKKKLDKFQNISRSKPMRIRP